jgi:hypothetical protein
MLNLFEKHFLFRRLAVVWMLGLMTWAVIETLMWALSSQRTGTDIALIVGAVNGSLMLFQGAVTGIIFKFYNDARVNSSAS